MMQFKVDSLLIPLAVPHIGATAGVEIIADEGGAQLNILDRNGMIRKFLRIEFGEKGELKLNAWEHATTHECPDSSIPLLTSDDTCEFE
jgi:hypothetical protein